MPDSSGGSVNDLIAHGRRFWELGMLTTVGVSVLTHSAPGERANVSPEAYCESMCVFLLLSGKLRYVPEQAHVRVHQIWMGDRADNAANLITTDMAAQLGSPNAAVVELTPKSVQDRFASTAAAASRGQE